MWCIGTVPRLPPPQVIVTIHRSHMRIWLSSAYDPCRIW